MHIKALIFDYGGTLDTRGNHWGKVIWHAYQQMGVPVSEQQFRDAYVYAERTLGRNPIIRPSYTFKLTLDVKLRLQLEYLAREFACDVQQGGEGIETPCATPEVQSPLAQLLSDSKAFKKIHQQLLFHLYDEVRQTVAESKAVLTQLAETYPMVLVSNFYGNVETVLHEMHLNHLFSHVIESAVVGIRKPDPQIFQLAVEALQRDFQASSGEQLQLRISSWWATACRRTLFLHVP